MSTSTKLAGFGLALVAVFGTGAGVGALAGPNVAVEEEAPPPEGQGVVSVVEGYRLLPLRSALDPQGDTFRFVVADQEGTRVRAYTETHEKDLHLIVVNRELTDFHHVHPDLGDDGVWSVELPALEPGAYRAVADFHITDGPRLALGVDLTVPGDYSPTALPEPQLTTTVDGYEVTLDASTDTDGEVHAHLAVRRNGELVIDLQDYLGAKGHLVAMRTGDLAYAHVHPEEGEGEPGIVGFDALLHSAGRYGLFFDFKHDGEVHTAAFTFDQGPVTDEPELEH